MGNNVNEFAMTTHRVMNRRGVIWLGQTCNIRCYFCYFLDKINAKSHPEHPMMPLEKAKAMCRVLRDHYGCNSVDIQGGEPLVWGDVYKLVAYCDEIGLKPTLITNGIQLAKMSACIKLKEAGVYDLLFSVHGIGATYDQIVGLPGGSEKQMQALRNLREVGIPFRFNCVLSKPVVAELPQLAELTFSSGARAMNFIAFNPFIDQTSGKRNVDTVASYREVMEILTPILDEFDRRHVECNVRYFPFCVFEERHRKFCQNFQQIIYDLHEWEAASEAWTGESNQRQAALALSPPVRLEETIWRRRIQWLECKAPDWIKSAMRPAIRILRNLDPRSTLPTSAETRIDVSAIRRGIRPAEQEAPVEVPIPAERPHPLLPVASFFESCIKLYREVVLGRERLTRLEYLHQESRRLMPLTVHNYTKCSECKKCDIAPICDGFHGDYGDLFSFAEAKPIKLGRKIYRPTYYMEQQSKVVEEQEYAWALPSKAITTA